MLSQSDLVQLLPDALNETNLPLPGKTRGKVRDWYDMPDAGQRLIVTTDRLSAFDRILYRVPYKGQVLNQLSAWWFDQTKDIIPNHIISLPDPNASLVTKVEPIMVEVVVRGYITGVTTTALWHRYSLGEREIYGYTFPEKLRKNEILPEPIITPTTKAVTGHDERLTLKEVVDQGILDADTWDQVQAAALAIFKRGQQVAAKAGLILVDTKYEFGRTADGKVVLIDEVHTPDSSRYWKEESYKISFPAGLESENFDKELVRRAYIERGYNGEGEPPELAPQLWAAVSQRYMSIYEMLTNEQFVPGAYPVEARLLENLKLAGLA